MMRRWLTVAAAVVCTAQGGAAYAASFASVSYTTSTDDPLVVITDINVSSKPSVTASLTVSGYDMFATSQYSDANVTGSDSSFTMIWDSASRIFDATLGYIQYRYLRVTAAQKGQFPPFEGPPTGLTPFRIVYEGTIRGKWYKPNEAANAKERETAFVAYAPLAELWKNGRRSISVGGAGGTYLLPLSCTPDPTDWDVRVYGGISKPWVTFVGATSGTGDGSVTIQVPANTNGAVRDCHLLVQSGYRPGGMPDPTAQLLFYVTQQPVGSRWDAGYTDLGGGWRRLYWFGDYIPMGAAGWIWHHQHGHLYVSPSTTPEGLWLYAQDMGWLWTGCTTYPYLYRASDRTWLWYNGSTNPRWFYNMRTGRWESRP
jgi:hypothetical protein